MNAERCSAGVLPASGARRIARVQSFPPARRPAGRRHYTLAALLIAVALPAFSQQIPNVAKGFAADQHYQRNLVTMKANLFGKALDGERGISVNPLIACLVRTLRGFDQSRRRIELSHHAVDGIALHSAFTSASGKRVRISKIEIAGRMRRNRNIAARNMPMVPM